MQLWISLYKPLGPHVHEFLLGIYLRVKFLCHMVCIRSILKPKRSNCSTYTPSISYYQTLKMYPLWLSVGVSHGFNLHSLVSNGVSVFVGHLVSSFVKCLFKSCAYFSTLLIVFSLLVCRSSFDIPIISSLSIICIANIFSHSWLNFHLFNSVMWWTDKFLIST